ncbi:hypothetical protein [Nocardia sp. XZ_19_369]|uniref:hypothetical protein n=1 Tax=Nocardia sp. XZ_19_369 TaxID=2769487 RepID=UPI00188FED8D|nr:hypothetical protein [Nocardia sp. XZ_19_369]
MIRAAWKICAHPHATASAEAARYACSAAGSPVCKPNSTPPARALLGGNPAVTIGYGYQFSAPHQSPRQRETNTLRQARDNAAHLLRTQKLRGLTPDAVVMSRFISAWIPRPDLTPE